MEKTTADVAAKPLLLLVDDVAENLQLLARLLADDYELAFASDGEQAIVLAVETHPSLILLDVMMPGIDGYETCRRLKSNLMVRAIPVIFLTARAEIEDVLGGFAAGGVDYVAKPFRSAELLARVRTHVELNRLRSFFTVCSQCHKIENERNEWERLDNYVARHTKTTFSHGYCPECYAKAMREIVGNQR